MNIEIDTKKYNVDDKQKREKEREFIQKTNSGEIISYCIFEKRRPNKYWRNHGEVLDTMNSADNDPWDICAFGYEGLFEKNRKYRIRRFIGELHLPNGNHKLIVEIDSNDAGLINSNKFKEEIEGYIHMYEKYKKWKRGIIKFIQY
jgi:inorganic pyrophosphatase